MIDFPPFSTQSNASCCTTLPILLASFFSSILCQRKHCKKHCRQLCRQEVQHYRLKAHKKPLDRSAVILPMVAEQCPSLQKLDSLENFWIGVCVAALILSWIAFSVAAYSFWKRLDSIEEQTKNLDDWFGSTRSKFKTLPTSAVSKLDGRQGVIVIDLNQMEDHALTDLPQICRNVLEDSARHVLAFLLPYGHHGLHLWESRGTRRFEVPVSPTLHYAQVQEQG